MQLPSTPRRAWARTKPTHFTYIGTDKGTQWEGYIAGPTWWGHLHMTKPSKPCVYELTGGKIACRYCGSKRVPVVKGWTPIYRQIDGHPCCVPVDEVSRDEIDGLNLHARVIVGRAKGRGASVYVRAALNQLPAWTSTLPERMEAADISASLLCMWAIPELFGYFEVPRRGEALPDEAEASDTPVSPAEPGKPVESWNRFVALGSVGKLEGTVSADRDARNQAFADEQRRKASRNGNGKH